MPASVVDDDLVIVRFGPFTPAGLKKNAEKTRLRDLAEGREPVTYGVSVFAIVPKTGETVQQSADRLCQQLTNVAGAPNGDRVAVTQARTLESKGFRLRLDEPPPGHYLVGSVEPTTMPDVEAMSAEFATRQKNPAFERGN